MATRIPLTSMKAMARRDILRSFLQRESPSSLPASTAAGAADAAPGPFASTSNPFAPTKAPGAKSSRAPKYSLRRQKELRKRVAMLGWPQHCLPPPYEKQTKHATEKQKGGDGGPQLMRSNPRIPATRVMDELELVKKGPYAGRQGAAFKGKAWERNLASRQQQLASSAEQAEAKVASWKQARKDERSKAKPSLPF